MATNEILQFASTNTGTNLLTQAEYTADAQRTTGNQPGIARSKLVNKALRQSSLLSAGLAEFIADYQANNVTDGLTPQNIADYLLAALTGALAVTPPQFDNDTSLATSAFVQRALGNFNSTAQYTDQTANIPASYAGRVIILGGAGNNLTLPNSSGMPIGSTFEFFGQGGSTTINAPSGHVLSVGAQNSGTQITLVGNEYATITLQATNVWAVTNGTPMLKGSGVFASNTSLSGYQKLPSGIIIQWGLNYGVGGAPNVNTPTYSTVYFPITFPNSVFAVCCNPQDTYGGNVQMSTPLVYVSNGSYFNYGNTDQDTGIGNYRWIAIGW